MELLLGYAFIFFARVIDVSMATVRMLMVVQGRKLHAASIGFFEIILYVTALNKVVNGLDNPLNLLAYAFGFACGNYVGITIENYIALGKLSAQIVLKDDDNEELIDFLRDNKFGVTVVEGCGKEGSREILNIALNRVDLNKLKDLVYASNPDAFITTSNINPVSGGYFSPKKRK